MGIILSYSWGPNFFKPQGCSRTDENDQYAGLNNFFTLRSFFFYQKKDIFIQNFGGSAWKNKRKLVELIWACIIRLSCLLPQVYKAPQYKTLKLHVKRSQKKSRCCIIFEVHPPTKFLLSRKFGDAESIGFAF